MMASAWLRAEMALLLTKLLRWLAGAENEKKFAAGPVVPGASFELLAVCFGVNEAHIVVKIHEWLAYNKYAGKRGHHEAGRWWTYNSYGQWRDAHFPWMSESTVARLFRKLEQQGVLIADQKRRQVGDCRLWWSIDYAVVGLRLHGLPGAVTPRAKMESGGVKMESALCQNGTPLVPKWSHIQIESQSQNPKPNRQTTTTTGRDDDGGTTIPIQKNWGEGRDSWINLQDEAPNGGDTPPPVPAHPLPLAAKIIAAEAIGMDALVAGRLAEQHGREMVESWCLTAKDRRLGAGWAVQRIRAGEMPMGERESGRVSIADFESNGQRYRTGAYAEWIQS
jgi:hypothetical protein